MNPPESETITIVSYNRPLTHSARKALDEYGIVKIESVDELNRWTVVELEERPSDDILDKHELRVDVDPNRIYKTDSGTTVVIYPDRVVNDGVEASLSPDEAIEYAEERGWERTDDETLGQQRL